MVISKEDFVQVINDVKNASEYQEALNKCYKRYNVDGYLFQPDCTQTVLKLLHIMFGNADIDNWIEYFCFELNFGKKWKEDMVRDKNGNSIRLSTPEELYDLLKSCREEV